MIGCTDPKYKCGVIVPDSCVPYTGPGLTFLDEEDQLSCDASVKDVIKAIDAQLKLLKDANTFTGLDLDCLTVTDDIVNNFNLHQAEILQICQNKANIAALTTQFNNWDITNEVVTIDLPACLDAGAAPCAVGTNQYQLSALLLLFANMLCDHETRIAALEP